ncbi:MAG TPA: toxic anion resistance protein, partial [Methylomirabilota bacterium]|nr:toxic anion resistance protein [Methylomirabilota bacterium]
MSTTTNLPVAGGKNLDRAVRELSLDVSTGGADSKADQDRIAAIKRDIDIGDTTAVLQFGANVQNTIAEFADSVLQTVTTKDSGEVGQRLSDLLLKIRG